MENPFAYFDREIAPLILPGVRSSVTPKEWNDVWRINVSGEYKVLDWLDLRASYVFDEDPVPDKHVDLHFETAYYAGIDRAIEKRLPLFEAGAQGEHKLLRGFEPSRTYWAHWIRHAGLAAAIEDYTQREAAAVEVELGEMAKFGPYRSDNDDH